jgi:DNA anti-recombination protein RmuC
MADANSTQDEDSLAQLYNETIDDNRAYLKRLHDSFNRHCEVIGEEAKKKLEAIPETEEEARQKILAEEKQQLDKTLAELKYAITKSSSDARATLEEIQNKLDSKTLDLDAELNQIK